MKKYLFSSVLILFISSFVLLSQSIILQRGNESFAYKTINEAINNSNNGDILYLPPGNFDVNGLQINKGIHIIGAGYHPKTTGAIGQTTISGNLTIVKGADGGSIQGLNFVNAVVFGTDASNCEVHNFTIYRCYIGGGIFLAYSWNGTTNGSNFTISENIILGGICGGEARNVLLTNNIINQTSGQFRPLTYFKNSIFSNNIVLPLDDYVSNQVFNCTFKNNVIVKGNLGNVNSYSGNIYLNNLHCSPNGLNSNGVVQSEGNVYIERSKMFVNATDDNFSFSNDYHLTQEALNTIKGTDGSQVGIYGGQYPFKDGAAPINPQIIEKKISSTTNPKGKLNVQIKVKAQNK